MPASTSARATERSLRPDTVKHYLETIYYIEFEEPAVRPGRIAEWVGVSAPTISVTLKRLAADGWISVASDRTVALTDQGRALAESIVRTHRLLERWLTDALGMDWASADQAAQEIAPGVSQDVAARIDEHLGHPRTCPHGNVIPGRTAPYGQLSSLAELPVGATGVVRRISEVAEHDAPDLLRRLDGHGLVTGAVVEVDERMPGADAVSVRVADQSLALGQDVASLIWVEPQDRTSRRRARA
jgi:DtxR family transcriptional regulator, Mn-dependent transcriptional regulator